MSDWSPSTQEVARRRIRRNQAVRRGVLATTATANARVTADVAEQLATGPGDLGEQVVVLRGSLDRESLRLAVLRLPTPQRRSAAT